MSPTFSPTTVAAIDAHEGEEVGGQLQAMFADLVDLTLIGKPPHGSVVGRDFRSLHLPLDELVASWRDLDPPIAERAVAIGYFPSGQADTAATTGHGLARRARPRGSNLAA